MHGLRMASNLRNLCTRSCANLAYSVDNPWELSVGIHSSDSSSSWQPTGIGFIEAVQYWSLKSTQRGTQSFTKVTWVRVKQTSCHILLIELQLVSYLSKHAFVYHESVSIVILYNINRSGFNRQVLLIPIQLFVKSTNFVQYLINQNTRVI